MNRINEGCQGQLPAARPNPLYLTVPLLTVQVKKFDNE
jgi:hypothetical protein